MLASANVTCKGWEKNPAGPGSPDNNGNNRTREEWAANYEKEHTNQQQKVFRPSSTTSLIILQYNLRWKHFLNNPVKFSNVETIVCHFNLWKMLCTQATQFLQKFKCAHLQMHCWWHQQICLLPWRPVAWHVQGLLTTPMNLNFLLTWHKYQNEYQW